MCPAVFELAKVPESMLHARSTLCLDDHQLSSENTATKGALEPIASRVVLKILYIARMGRPDILWLVDTFARQVAKDDRGCDKRLHCLVE